jgi:hypothetical protein
MKINQELESIRRELSEIDINLTDEQVVILDGSEKLNTLQTLIDQSIEMTLNISDNLL